MGNPIQYRNTNNPSQMGALATTRGDLSQQPIVFINPPPGLIKTGKPLWYAPWAFCNGGVNENFTLGPGPGRAQ